VIADGTLRCWGENDHGELGLGSFTTTGFNGIATPQPVTLPKAVTAVTAQYEGTCALLSDGTVYCWGWNNDGDLGIGSFTTTGNQSVATPGKVLNLPGAASAISGGHAHACAVVGTAAWCWGENYNGELGNGVFQTSLPVGVDNAIQVSSISNVTQVAAGCDFTCALAGGSVSCWGWNYDGNLGNQTYNDAATPQAVVPSWTGSVLSIVAGSGREACALINGGNVYCWGEGDYGELGASFFVTTSPPGINYPVAVSGAVSAVSAVAVGDAHACAINGDGSVSCWGDNEFGELGNGSIISAAPYGVDTAQTTKPLPHPATAIAAGGSFTCALLSDGSVWCWGYNQWGELGNGNETTSPNPVQVTGW
jgi:alpha-tubulin suppressor-like RCC1 family protein